MFQPFASVLITGATTTVGYFFQENSAKNVRLRQETEAELENRRQLRDAELRQAQEIFKEISPAMDLAYYYLMHGAMYVAVRKAKDDNTREKQDLETWDEYESAMVSWMTHKSRWVAQVGRYFGEENRRRLEAIQNAFKEAASLVDATYYNRKNSVVKDGKESSGKFYAIVSPLENQLVELNEQMIKEIQSQNIGQLRTKERELNNQGAPRIRLEVGSRKWEVESRKLGVRSNVYLIIGSE